MKMYLDYLRQLCRSIDEGYAAEKSGYDDDMIALLIELSDMTGDIRNLIDLVEKARPHMQCIADSFDNNDQLAARQWLDQAGTA